MATVTRESVFEAADAIAATGEIPIQAVVRERLGGGSFSTIGPFLREWQNLQVEKREVRETPIPETVQAALTEVGGRLWREAQNAASLGVESARREVEDMKSAAAKAEAEAAEVVRIVEEERDKALEMVESFRAKFNKANEELGDERVRRLHAEADAIKSKEQVRTAEARVEAAVSETARADAAKEEAAQRAVEAIVERDIAQAEAVQVRRDATEAIETMRREGAKMIETAQAEAAALREQVAATREQVARLTAERDGLTARLAATEAAVEKAEAAVEKAERRADRAEDRAAKAEAKAAEGKGTE